MGCHASKGGVVDTHAHGTRKAGNGVPKEPAVAVPQVAGECSRPQVHEPTPPAKQPAGDGLEHSAPEEFRSTALDSDADRESEVPQLKETKSFGNLNEDRSSSGSTLLPEDSESFGSSPHRAGSLLSDRTPRMVPFAKDWHDVATQAVEEAQRLMQTDALVLQAEAVLCQTLSHLAAAGSQGEEAAKVITESSIFEEVRDRSFQFDSLAGLLRPSSFVLQWEKDNACLWVNAPAGETWFEFKVAGYFDAPLQHMLVALHEIDLQPKYQPMLAGAPQFLGDHGRHLLVTRTLVDILVLRIELIIEVMRFVDHRYGFLAERIRSDFPLDKKLQPAKSWRNKRIAADTRSMVVPCGGGKPGCITMQASRVDLGFQLPKYALDFFCSKLSQDYLNNLRTCLRLVAQPNSPWSERLAADKDGFYAELARADEVAQTREEVSLHNLPGPEIFDRPWRFSNASFA
mmetsp:Transcript_28776/g.66875  ORF Transcript_28776/g.66875 Transcript_28776/m.66875 type:complete len:458 (+) Transcript_28776:79-1452(+)